MKDVKEYSVK